MSTDTATAAPTPEVTFASLAMCRLPEEDVQIEGVGTVRIRSLSRNEVLGIKGVELPVAEMERRLLAASMVQPKLTEDQVRAWQDAAPAGELEPLTQAIMRLSGLSPDAPKEAVKGFRG